MVLRKTEQDQAGEVGKRGDVPYLVPRKPEPGQAGEVGKR